MENKPSVAVVILNWNGADFLMKFLPSVVKYSQPARVIVADNGSTDNSAEVVKNNFPSVEFLQLPQNYGFAKGYNEALRQIKADYYVLLNSDVEVTEGWVEQIVEFMERNKDVAAVMPKILAYDNRTMFEYAGASGGFIDKLGYPFCRGRIFDTIEQDKGQYNDVQEVFWASGAAMFVRAEDYHSLGGLDEDFWAHMEEIDFCWRVKNSGKKIYVFPRVKVFHVGGGSLSYGNKRKVFLNHRNNLFMLYKNLPKGKLWLVILTRMVMDGLSALSYLSKGGFGAFGAVIKAHWHFWKSQRVLKQKRKNLISHNRFDYKQVYNKSIVWQYFAAKKTKFSDLKF